MRVARGEELEEEGSAQQNGAEYSSPQGDEFFEGAIDAFDNLFPEYSGTDFGAAGSLEKFPSKIVHSKSFACSSRDERISSNTKSCSDNTSVYQ